MGRGKYLHFITNQRPRPSLLQMSVKDRKHALNLLSVPISRFTDWLILLEPNGLAEVRTLSTHLEVQPLLYEILLSARAVAQGIVLVVGFLELF